MAEISPSEAIKAWYTPATKLTVDKTGNKVDCRLYCRYTTVNFVDSFGNKSATT